MDFGSVVVLVTPLAAVAAGTEDDSLSRSRGAEAATAGGGDCSLLIVPWLELLVAVNHVGWVVLVLVFVRLLAVVSAATADDSLIRSRCAGDVDCGL
jgi:hypothetical protein